MLSKFRLIQLVVMLTVLVFLFIWRTMQESNSIEQQPDNDLPEVSQPTTIKKVIEQSDPSEPLCDFTKACVFKTIYGEFLLSVKEKQIVPEQWIHLSLQSELKDWRVKQAKTVGKSMFMGKIPIQFSEQNTQMYTAKTMVGACTEKEMVWRFDISLEVQGQPIRLYYDFAIVH